MYERESEWSCDPVESRTGVLVLVALPTDKQGIAAVTLWLFRSQFPFVSPEGPTESTTQVHPGEPTPIQQYGYTQGFFSR